MARPVQARRASRHGRSVAAVVALASLAWLGGCTTAPDAATPAGGGHANPTARGVPPTTPLTPASLPVELLVVLALDDVRTALPPGTEVEATLEGEPAPGAPTLPVASLRQPALGTGPFRASLRYDPARLPPEGRYRVRGTVRLNGRPVFASATGAPLPAAGAAQEVTLQLSRVRDVPAVAAVASAPAVANAPLENVYWKLVELRGRAVAAMPGQRQEPHVVLQSATQRLSGFGGCNRLAGRYELDGARLTVVPTPPAAGSSAAVPCAGHDLERELMQALVDVRSRRIEARRLSLDDAAARPVAVFEATLLR